MNKLEIEILNQTRLKKSLPKKENKKLSQNNKNLIEQEKDLEH